MHESGTVLQGRYRVERLLGRGGMGEVYLATHLKLGVSCAIKTLQVTGAEAGEREAFGRLFEREARLLASLDHPHLARVTDFFEEDGRAWLVMELVEGATLGSTCGVPMAEERVLAVASQVLDALEYLHSREPPVIVRDLKPDNLMQAPDGRVLLIDFGIAKVMEPMAGTATVVRHCGTRGFAPLEQYTDAGTDPRSDLYALGATMACLLSGEVPPDPAERITRQASLPAMADVSERTARAVRQMMGIAPGDRPSSAAEARRLLFGTEAVSPRDGEAARLGLDLVPAAPHALAPTEPASSLVSVGARGARERRRAGLGRLTFLAVVVVLAALCGTWGTGAWWRSSGTGSGAQVKEASLHGITWGAGLLVAVGSRGTILTSPDGVQWTRRVSGTTGFLRSVVRGRGQFVAVGEGGMILTSGDGVVWDLAPSMSADFLRGVTYGNGVFVAVGSGGTIITSADGLAWESRTLAGSPGLNGVTWGRGQFVAVGDEALIVTSPDGLNWTPRASGTTNPIQGVTYGGGVFVAVGDAGTVLTSTDGLTWSSRTWGRALIHQVAHGRGQFVAVSHTAQEGSILTSPDSVAWTIRSTGQRLLNSVAWVDGQFVAVGVEFVAGGAPRTVVSTSVDGVRWTDR